MQSIKPENLVFLISQPRSGSSLLQQLLMNTGEILSVPEPWIMLPLVYIYKGTSITAGYNPKYANINFSNYMNKYPGARDLLKERIRQTALDIYNLNKLGTNQRYFLDKTPRYFHIVYELLELFPEARFIILYRNPASVFASILDYNFRGRVTGIFEKDRLEDLLKAPYVISRLITDKSTYASMFFIRYEDMISEPEIHLNQLAEYLGIKYKYNRHPSYKINEEFLNTQAVDRKSLTKHTTLSDDYIESWKVSINDSHKKYILLEYIQLLGQEIFANMGYSYADTLERIKQHPVKFKIPVKWTIMERYKTDLSILELMYYKMTSRLNNLLTVFR